jgi:hypothetical protein
MKYKLLEQAKHEYSPKQQFVALLFLAPIFLLERHNHVHLWIPQC